MRLVEALGLLQRLDQVVVETGDVAVVLGISRTHASKLLARLEEAGQLLGLRRGVWAFPGRLDLMATPAWLTAPQPAYVSLQSALYHHGMISQIPVSMYAISLARTRRYVTPLGVVSIHHVAPDFFFGYDAIGEKGIRMAQPEKALLDVFYLTPARTRLFCDLPEVERPDDFNIPYARDIISRIPFSSRRNMVTARFDQWLAA